jgi:two-component system sensor histidine kinase TctE
MKRNLPSLRRQLLQYLLIPLSILWLLSAVATFYFANRYANVAYDRALLDSARTLGAEIMVKNGAISLDLPEIAWKILRYNKQDKIYFQVLGPAGELIYGDQAIPHPPGEEIILDKPQFHNGVVAGEPIRIASYYHALEPDRRNRVVLVQAAETLTKRRVLAEEILLGMLVPLLLLIGLAAISVWMGVGYALVPLGQLALAINSRSHRDLSPISAGNAPLEVHPLLHSTNALMARLSEVLQAQQRFIANASHQLRTPLAGLKMQTDYALRQKDPAELQRALTQINAGVERTTHLVQQLLSLARAEITPSQALPFEPVDLNQLVRETTTEWVPEALKKAIDLGYEGPGGVIRVHGNPLLLREMLVNVLDNAIRYTPQGGCVTVHLSQRSSPLLVVEDNGPGVPSDQQSLVFERFHRVLGNNDEGSGLGLAIVREIVHAHHARVWLTTPAEGRGTCVNIEFITSLAR